jgi:hypothetical protein
MKARRARTKTSVLSGGPRSDSENVLDWRIRRLTAAGFERRLARELACDRGVDLHALLDLRDRGCPPELAARIVAPLGRPPR